MDCGRRPRRVRGAAALQSHALQSAAQDGFYRRRQPPASVAADLRAACYDCHSHETVWPLYSRIAPVSWLIASDVNEGRQHLNFSDWPAEAARAAKNLDRINEVVDYREMPPKKYTLLHADARLTEAQRKDVLAWTEAAASQLRSAKAGGDASPPAANR